MEGCNEMKNRIDNFIITLYRILEVSPAAKQLKQGIAKLTQLPSTCPNTQGLVEDTWQSAHQNKRLIYSALI